MSHWRDKSAIVGDVNGETAASAARMFPGLVERMTLKAYRDMLTTRPSDAAPRTQ